TRGAVHRNGGNAVAIIVHDPHPCWEPCLAVMPYPLANGVHPNVSGRGAKRFNRVCFKAPWPGWSDRSSDNEKIVVIQHRKRAAVPPGHRPGNIFLSVDGCFAHGRNSLYESRWGRGPGR